MDTADDNFSTEGNNGEQTRYYANEFSLLRWFSILSFLIIFVAGVAMAAFLTKYLTENMISRDAEVSRDFIESIINTENTLFGRKIGLDRVVEHLPRLPAVLQANLYSPDRIVLWSSEKRLVGRQFDDNPELEQALKGEIVASFELVDEEYGKTEHTPSDALVSASPEKRFVETYLPIRDKNTHEIIGVVETYRRPTELFRSIDDGVRLVWASAAAMGIVLYGSLFWIVRRADQIMTYQRAQLSFAEALSVVGEMAAAVAHSIRNPLASIRSSAELAQEEDRDGVQQCLRDIMSETDRVDGWIRELLLASRDGAFPVAEVDLNALIDESIRGAEAEMQRRNIRLALDVSPLPLVLGTRPALAHALRNIISNALDAMPTGGELRVESCSMSKDRVRILIEDDGPGMPPDVMQHAFRPLFTTKPNGTGLGLALARRIIERHEGHIELANKEGRGTRVVLTLPAGA